MNPYLKQLKDLPIIPEMLAEQAFWAVGFPEYSHLGMEKADAIMQKVIPIAVKRFKIAFAQESEQAARFRKKCINGDPRPFVTKWFMKVIKEIIKDPKFNKQMNKEASKMRHALLKSVLEGLERAVDKDELKENIPSSVGHPGKMGGKPSMPKAKDPLEYALDLLADAYPIIAGGSELKSKISAFLQYHRKS